ncbi:hypothetical protein RZS08_62795, partial [Arthrospira platensis SPKY1]|nr:hypothetical protein [Arthrospira platensis SPKY1]
MSSSISVSTPPPLRYTDIVAPLQQELEAFRRFFNDQLQTEVPLLGQVLRYLTRQQGKQMRPLLVMLSARLFGPINER